MPFNLAITDLIRFHGTDLSSVPADSETNISQSRIHCAAGLTRLLFLTILQARRGSLC